MYMLLREKRISSLKHFLSLKHFFFSQTFSHIQTKGRRNENLDLRLTANIGDTIDLGIQRRIRQLSFHLVYLKLQYRWHHRPIERQRRIRQLSLHLVYLKLQYRWHHRPRNTKKNQTILFYLDYYASYFQFSWQFSCFYQPLCPFTNLSKINIVLLS